VVVLATLQVGGLILTESVLSFLGVGIPGPDPAWGSMVSDGRDHIADAWWISMMPGLAIFLTIFAFNFLGDWLRDNFDPRLRQL
jgi:peptide/nickel transport system permease protein